MKNRFGSYRRIAGIGVCALALFAGVAIGWHMRAPSANAQESAVAIAEMETERFYQALSGSGALADVLGDAFQLVRADGVRHDRASYLADQPTVSSYRLDDFKAVQAGDVLTATFFSSNTAVVEGVAHDTVGRPRLAVFSKVGGDWKLQAFANLGLGLASDIDSEARKAVEAWTSTAASGDVAGSAAFSRRNSRSFDRTAPPMTPRRIWRAAFPGSTRSSPSTTLSRRVSANIWLSAMTSMSMRAVAGGRIDGTAPRLTVFRRSGDGWLVVAHANFAPVAP